MLPDLSPIRLERPADLAALAKSAPDLFSDEQEHIIRQHCLRHGTVSEFFGRVGAGEVAVIGEEMREHLWVAGLNSRQRALAELTAIHLRTRNISPADAKIYAHEAISTLALALRGRYPKFIGTEYAPSEETRAKLFPILHGDICNSTFPSAVFDLVLSGDVLEHVPDLDAALREGVRILKPGGLFAATFPFLHTSIDRSIRRAEYRNGKLVHHYEPIYHGDPMNPEGGSLVFELPSWDVIERARLAGFSDASMNLICDQVRGIVASHLGDALRPRGVFVALFYK